MPIQASDIRQRASNVMADVPEGGGGPSGNFILDGTSNVIFPDVTEAARAGGQVSIRQLFLSVVTPDTEEFMDANIIVAQPPNDANVSITLAKCAMFHRRTDIANAIENYLIQGPEWGGYLLENHVAGQRSVQIFQRPGAPTPPVGRTLVLLHEEGQPGEVRQYVRVTRVEVADRTFTYSNNGGFVDYPASVVTCDISDALRTNFPGSTPNREYARDTTKTVIRDTTVADAAAYYGASPLSAVANLGDSSARVSSIYSQIVPSTRTETVALDQRPGAQRTIVLAESPRRVEVGATPHTQRVKIGQENRAFSYVQILTPLPSPGTVRVAFLALGNWYELTDDGQGVLTGQGSGTVNYATGSISVTLPALPDAQSSLIFSWGERTAYANMSGLATFRPPEFSFDLTHKGIDPGSLSVTWLSGGSLKTAVADAEGDLSGDATGFVSHISGLITIRPSAMLDAGGEFSLSYTWSPTVVETKTGLDVSLGGFTTFATEQVPVEGSVLVEWFTARTVSATSGSKLASGSSTKSSSVNSGTQATQVIDSKRNHIPGFDSYPYSYSGGGSGSGTGAVGGFPPQAPVWTPARDSVTETPRVLTSTVTEDTAGGSSSKLTVSSTQSSETVISVFHTITENGSGGFLNSLGTINYAGKTITLKVVDTSTSATSYASDTESAADFSSAQTQSSADPGQAGTLFANYKPANSSSVSGTSGGSSASQGGVYYSTAVKEVFDAILYVTYRTGTGTATPHTESYAPDVVQIDLAPYTTNRVVPGSVQFTWMGHSYQDFEGVLYRGRTGASGGISAGVIDYITGVAHVTDYVVAGSPTNFFLESLWVSKGGWTTSKVFFRTPLAPLQPGGLSLSVLDTSGSQILATANLNGEMVGDHCLGRVDYQTGVVDMIFGDLVLDSALSPEDKAEWWYAKALTQITPAGKIWRPWPVDPTTLRFNSVAYFYLPMDASILGLDPVRLPQDGRVPIFRVGSFVVVGHTGSVGPATLSNGVTVDCARERLSRVRLVGADGAVIPTGYTADLEAGVVTVTDVTGWVQPVTVQHRIEDMVRCRDVQIDGTLAFTRQLSHDFPVGSIVSSAIMTGTLFARMSLLFDQQTWDGVSWTDSLEGDAAPSTYNASLAPIEVTNAGALTERWALRFTSSTAFQIIGEHVGNIGTGSINVDCSPINPIAGVPYFTIRATGWGAGWAVGNIVRLNTVGAIYPYAAIRTVQQGPAAGLDYRFELLGRGDVDRPPSAP